MSRASSILASAAVGWRCDPALDQSKGVVFAPLFGQQHRQTPVTIGVVVVPIQAEIVVCFGLIEIGLAVFDLAEAMVRGRQIVVGVGIVRVGVGRLLKLLDGLLVSGLLEEPNAFGVPSLGVEPAATGQAEQEPCHDNPLDAKRGVAKPTGGTMGGFGHGLLASPNTGKREDSDRFRRKQERFRTRRIGVQCKRKDGANGRTGKNGRAGAASPDFGSRTADVDDFWGAHRRA